MARPSDLQRLVRRELLTRLKAAADLTALVPPGSIAPQGAPAWPFILVDSPRTQRLRSSCVQGARVQLDVHVFAGPKLSGATVIATAYDHVSEIAAEVEGVLADNRIALPGGPVCRLELSDTQFLKDAEPDSWHWVAQANARVLAE